MRSPEVVRAAFLRHNFGNFKTISERFALFSNKRFCRFSKNAVNFFENSFNYSFHCLYQLGDAP